VTSPSTHSYGRRKCDVEQGCKNKKERKKRGKTLGFTPRVLGITNKLKRKFLIRNFFIQNALSQTISRAPF
jgi:hypothetical protein